VIEPIVKRTAPAVAWMVQWGVKATAVGWENFVYELSWGELTMVVGVRSEATKSSTDKSHSRIYYYY
jgi:hypothetical protein